MRRALQITAWTVGSVLLLVVVLAAAVLIGGNTARGRALIEQATFGLTDGHVRLAGLSGSFPGAIDLEQLRLSDARGVWLTAEGISLRWSPVSLLSELTHCSSVEAGRAVGPTTRRPD